MKQVILAAAISCLLSACGSSSGSGGGGSPLTESECRGMEQHSNEIVKAGSGVDVQAIAGAAQADETFIANCAAGKSHNREEYECAMSANSMESLNKCTAQAARRL